ncbi:DUF2165 family protein [Shewanella surugensis]|uniref:DUF2165 domain-containing protein n=1 Tax=Shewanella surugensis TaxID=212020 RepID=A0ABT0LF09_9GAMM|nr:DUF2165 family protein [Shewanella surugensis]MCL1126292.1 DUF2165 domain-containing protein [Shewanella surugensis]
MRNRKGLCTFDIQKCYLPGVLLYLRGLVAWNNMTDYESSYGFIFHVLKMNTTFPNNAAMWRAVETPILYHLVYGGIIAIESLIALLCTITGIQLFRYRHDLKVLSRAKG